MPEEWELLAIAGNTKKPASSLEVWLCDNFFEEHCKLFHHGPFIWHIWDGEKDGFHCLVDAHRLTGPECAGRRTLEAITYSYLGDWIDRQKAAQKEGREGADARLATKLCCVKRPARNLSGPATRSDSQQVRASDTTDGRLRCSADANGPWAVQVVVASQGR